MRLSLDTVKLLAAHGDDQAKHLVPTVHDRLPWVFKTHHGLLTAHADTLSRSQRTYVGLAPVGPG